MINVVVFLLTLLYNSSIERGYFMQDNKEKLKQLFDQYSGDIYKAVFFLCRDAELTEKIVSETFIQAFNNTNILQATHESDIKLGLVNLATTLCKEEVKDQLEELSVKRMMEESHLNHGELYADEFEGNIRSALSDMDPDTKEVFILYYYDQMTYNEIAKKMDMNVEIVKYRLAKLNEILHKQLQAYIQLD